MVVMGALGLILERVFFRPVVGNIMSGMCVAIGLFLILETIAAVSFGASDKRIPSLMDGSFEILYWALPKDRSVAVGVSLILVLCFYVLIKKSKYGQAIVATAQCREGIMLQGVNPNRMSQLVMFIGSAFAAAAGALAGAIFLLNPYIGGPALMNAIIVVVLAGLGSVLGIVISGLVVGFANAILPIIFGTGVGAVAPFVLIMIILIFKPLGLFGHE
jgi:branched-chain amino acid transport system permease protein